VDKELQECGICKEKLPFSFFHKNVRYKSGYYKHCKKCHYEHYGRDAHFRRCYGISQKEYNEMLISQGFKCMTCGAEHGNEHMTRLVVDHCHTDKGVRGLLCQGCNMALGSAKDNPETLRNLANYLDEYYGT
jgi:hypothetical protein